MVMRSIPAATPGETPRSAASPALARGDGDHKPRVASTSRVAAVFADGVTGPAEVEALCLIECGQDGRIVSSTIFDPGDLARATAVLDARHAELTAGNAE
jgi:hypothetical protein